MKTESQEYLTEQIITYLGNKRGLRSELLSVFDTIHRDLGGKKLVTMDLFSGSGAVARMMKQFSAMVVANDLESYSEILNSCYLSNYSEFDETAYAENMERINAALAQHPLQSIISQNYAPRCMNNIQPGERVFFTPENAVIIDTVRNEIDKMPRSMQKYFLAPLIYEASVHNNTGGVFKGFYKDSNGVGKYGGTGENALFRILGKISLPKPVFSAFETEYAVYREDANTLAPLLPPADLVYIDPPYNQHPYGSNYFMLNIIADRAINGQLSPVSGIPDGWNRSAYNKRSAAFEQLEQLVNDVRSRFIVLSYNSEGFIPYDAFEAMLNKYGDVHIRKIRYNTYRASRNLNNRSTYVNEYIFILKKRSVA